MSKVKSRDDIFLELIAVFEAMCIWDKVPMLRGRYDVRIRRRPRSTWERMQEVMRKNHPTTYSTFKGEIESVMSQFADGDYNDDPIKPSPTESAYINKILILNKKYNNQSKGGGKRGKSV